jgi:hypothetical protein
MAQVICLDNRGYKAPLQKASLKRGKSYVALRDRRAERYGLLRVIDESGDSYLYPQEMFRIRIRATEQPLD